MYVYLERDFEEIKELSKEEIECLIAREGILVEKREKKGLYFNDNLRMINEREKQAIYRELKTNKKYTFYNRQMAKLEYISDKTGMSIAYWKEVLHKSIKNGVDIPFAKQDNVIYILPSWEQARFIVDLYNNHPNEFRLIHYIDLEFAKEIIEERESVFNIRGYRDLDSYHRQKSLEGFDILQINKFKYIKRKDMKEANKKVKEILKRWKNDK